MSASVTNWLNAACESAALSLAGFGNAANALPKLKVNITATAVEVFILEIAKEKSIFEVDFAWGFRLKIMVSRHKKELEVKLFWNTYSLVIVSLKVRCQTRDYHMTSVFPMVILLFCLFFQQLFYYLVYFYDSITIYNGKKPPHVVYY